MGKKFEFQVEKQERLIPLAARQLSITKAAADRLVKSGEVKVNGKRVKINAELKSGDTVTAFLPYEFGRAKAETVYQDDNVVVFNKPKHMTYEAVAEGHGAPLFAVHRLDTNTTGLIVFAKTENACEALKEAFKTRQVHKVYHAVVSPPPKEKQARLSAYYKKCDGVAIVKDRAFNDCKTIVTCYTELQRTGEYALMQVEPETGRMHQIRAHLAFIGCPILGDDKYGGCKISGVSSQMLCAVQLSFDGLIGELSYLNDKTFSVDSGFDLKKLFQKGVNSFITY